MNVQRLLTGNERLRGVIGREPVDFDTIFVFNEIYPGDGFHMHGVKEALDIVFLDRDLAVVKIDASVLPEVGTATAPPATCYAAEIMAGGAAYYELTPGKVWRALSNVLLNPQYGKE